MSTTVPFRFSMKTLLVSFVALCLFSFPFQADAHATPIYYEPSAFASLTESPQTVSISFSERIEPAISEIRVLGSAGQRLDDGHTAVSPSDPRLLTVALQDKAQGTVIVSWNVVSADDGHFTKGAFSFTVGTATPLPPGQTQASQFEVIHRSTLPEASTIWLELLGQAILFATLIVYAFVWRRLRTTDDGIAATERERGSTKGQQAVCEAKDFQKSYLYIMIGGIALIIIGTLAYLGLDSFNLHNLQSLPLMTALMDFSHTVAGSYALYRTALIALFAVIFIGSYKKILASTKFTIYETLLLIILLSIEYLRVRVSHSAASLLLPDLSIAITFVHLIFKNLWVGSLITLNALFLPVLIKRKQFLPLARLLASFSKLIGIVIAIVIATGSYIIWLDLKNLANIFTTEWGIGFAILSVFGSMLLGIRLYHQFFFEPRFTQLLKKDQHDKSQIFQLFPYTFSLEAFTGAALLLITSILIITTPPQNTLHNFIKTVSTATGTISLQEHPYEDGKCLITITPTGVSRNQQLAISDIVVTATNTTQSIGPLPLKIEQRFIGGYVFNEADLAPPGQWRIDVTAKQSQAYDIIAGFDVNYPIEVVSQRIPPQQRSFGFLETLLTLGSLVFALAAIVGYHFSKNLEEPNYSGSKIMRLCSDFFRACTTGVLKVRRGARTEKVGREARIYDPVDRNEQLASLMRGQGAWLMSAIVIGIIASAFLGFHGSHPGFFRTKFEQECEKQGYSWHQNIPQRQGRIVSSNSVIGCTIQEKGDHFADQREFDFFISNQSQP